jgi:hypothetical protein
MSIPSIDQSRMKRALEGNFEVKSQTAIYKVKDYQVEVKDDVSISCTCPDHVHRKVKCKHMITIDLSCGKRKITCAYGLSCYRKNLEHFQTHSHPEGFKIPQDAFPQNNIVQVDNPVHIQVSTQLRRSTRTSRPPSRFDPSI